ncbi:hypothetical protein ABZ502_32625 [Streptomyces abikoensis]|uniref:hypothetical protein n=1 Tax=Streptomyces abikoensis TaxID=97398 RepID=UPI003410A0C7
MTHASRTAAVAMRFTDGDTVSFTSGSKWVRGLRQSGQWAEFGTDAARTDATMRNLLATTPDASFIPTLPNVYKPLPGTACSSREALHNLALRPATSATFYTAALNRVQSFLGNENGVLRSGVTPTPLALPAVRASLQSTLTRHPRATITYHRMTGRLYARYAVGQSAIHTHMYVLTAGTRFSPGADPGETAHPWCAPSARADLSSFSKLITAAPFTYDWEETTRAHRSCPPDPGPAWSLVRSIRSA